MNILDELTPIFRQVFDDDTITLSSTLTADDIDDWDSLTHMNLVAAIEIQYKIKFALGELQKLKNVGQLAELVVKKLTK